MSINHIARGYELKNSRGNLKRLIIFTLLDYKYQFIEGLYTTDHNLQTQVLSVSLLFT